MAMQDDVVALRKCAFERYLFAGKISGHALEIVDKGLFAICDFGIVLDISRADIAFYRFKRAVLIKHQVVEDIGVRLALF